MVTFDVLGWCLCTGNKFAVGSGARCISVCYFEKENDWLVMCSPSPAAPPTAPGMPIVALYLCFSRHPQVGEQAHQEAH